jgi:hypothetical protein
VKMGAIVQMFTEALTYIVLVLGVLLAVCIVAIRRLSREPDRWPDIQAQVSSRRTLLQRMFDGKPLEAEPPPITEYTFCNVQIPPTTGKGKTAASAERKPEPPEVRRLKLAAVDLFVEKVQQVLSWRGRTLAGVAVLCAWVTLTSLVAGAYVLNRRPHYVPMSVADATVHIAEATARGAFLVAIPAFFIYLTRTLLHESSVQFNRRHAIRFGRLFVYLSGDPINIQDLDKAFNWSGEYESAFKAIKHDGPQGLTGLAGKLADTAANIAESAAKIAATANKE